MWLEGIPGEAGPLAQLVEHLTFNQGVPSSNLGWVTNYLQDLNLCYGGVSERFKELVLKTSDSERDRGFESHPLRHTFQMEMYSSRLKRMVC